MISKFSGNVSVFILRRLEADVTVGCLLMRHPRSKLGERSFTIGGLRAWNVNIRAA